MLEMSLHFNVYEYKKQMALQSSTMQKHSRLFAS